MVVLDVAIYMKAVVGEDQPNDDEPTKQEEGDMEA